MEGVARNRNGNNSNEDIMTVGQQQMTTQVSPKTEGAEELLRNFGLASGTANPQLLAAANLWGNLFRLRQSGAEEEDSRCADIAVRRKTFTQFQQKSFGKVTQLMN